MPTAITLSRIGSGMVAVTSKGPWIDEGRLQGTPQTAIDFEGLPPAVVKPPLTHNRGAPLNGEPKMQLIDVLLNPLAKADQAVPLQRAMPLQTREPTLVKPPA